MAENKGNTYLVVTANGDWQELGEAGEGATIWELPDWASEHLNEDPGSINDTLEEHGRAVADFYKNESGALVIGGDVEEYVSIGFRVG